MSLKRVKKYAHLVIYLKNCEKKECDKIIHIASKDLIDFFSEILFNFKKKNIKLNSTQKNNLRKFTNEAILLLKRNTSLKRKKKILQKGGFLQTILAPIIGLISGLIGEAIARKK